ncbi:hypothetical protein [Tenacibaculum sp. SG-28]|uniref:hypothetical protein n=1 Tax=Tenacibaculum sp. SG-28 TaxID=754426 RepID=UPI000CF4637C|nr:hypothetical protein [Tenacibaculum sp. SG-28]PQJ21931.1 hypothetical protein BSU00_07875 [Tenacibaculum sp. SG-28]
MKRLKILFLFFATSAMFISCDDPIDDGISLNQLLSSYDLWYVDYNRTEGTGDVPFVSRAFTMSFFNGRMFANNNIADIGITGNGLGIEVGSYGTFSTVLETNHIIDGRYDFDVVQLSRNQIRIDCLDTNVSYYLIGYQRSNFDYDMLFYDNIEYFLQEYVAWERTGISGGIDNVFDEEHYLEFTPENITTFRSSQDPFGTDIDNILWDFVGSYEVTDVRGYEYLKYLTLYYDGGDREEFELNVLDDQTIELYHFDSDRVYRFSGRGFIQILKGDKTSAKTKAKNRNSNRKRTRVKRKTVDKRVLK